MGHETSTPSRMVELDALRGIAAVADQATQQQLRVLRTQLLLDAIKVVLGQIQDRQFGSAWLHHSFILLSASARCALPAAKSEMPMPIRSAALSNPNTRSCTCIS